MRPSSVYLGIKYKGDFSNFALIETITKTLERAGCNTPCIVRDVEQWGMVQLEPEDLMRRTLQAIDVSDVVLLEFSEKGVGLGIEAGYAYAKGEPVVVVAKQGADISTTLRGISQKILFYSSREELADLVKLIAEGL